MQIIETGILGVRSAFIQFEASHDDIAPVFQLFPMLHIAEQDFYSEVLTRLQDCDIILCERG